MKKIDFKNFKVFTDITQTETRTTDMSRDLADMIYKKANGIVAHDLAFRIYKSEGDIELNDEEMSILTQFIKTCTPIFQDSFNMNIHE